MRALTRNEMTVVTGGAINNPAQCASDIDRAGALGGAVLGVLGAGVGLFFGGFGSLAFGALGTLGGIAGGGALGGFFSDACGPLQRK